MVVAEGAEVGIDSEWAPFLDEAIQLAGSLVEVGGSRAGVWGAQVGGAPCQRARR